MEVFAHGVGGQKDRKNKRTLLIEEKLKSMDCPFEGMQRVGQLAEEKGDYSTAGRMYSELASYLRSKPRMVDTETPRHNPLSGMTLEELESLKTICH